MKTYFKKERSKEEISKRLFIKTSYKNNMKQTNINNTLNKAQTNIKGGNTMVETTNINNKFNNIDNIIAPSMIDSYEDFKTKNILYGEYIVPNDYVKKIIVKVIKAYSIDSERISDNNEWTKFYNDLYKNVPDYDYDLLISLLKKTKGHTNNNNTGEPTIEYVISSAMYAYKSQDAELFTRTINTFGRPLKLKDGKNTWLDNWSINGPCNALNFVFWNDYDNNNIITINQKKPNKFKFEGNQEMNGEINETNNEEEFNKLNGGRTTKDIITQFDLKHTENDGYKCFMLKIVGIFRSFLIVNHLLPSDEQYFIKSCKDVCDISIKYFPHYYIACGGCNMFNDDYAPSIKTIKSFLNIYPEAFISCIVNTAQFGDPNGGAHWMALCFNINRACLLCPQANSWKILKDNGALYNSIINNNFATEYNNVLCQKDNCNCGVYSVLFVYSMLLHNGNMIEAVKQVGINADNINTKNKNHDTIFKVKNTLFGYQ